MPGANYGRKGQVGLETTPGTKVPATFILRANTASIKDNTKYVHVDELIGIDGAMDNGYFEPAPATWDVPTTKLSPLMAAYAIMYGLQGSKMGIIIAGTTPSGYSYSANFSTTDTFAITNTATIETGDTVEAEVATYGVINHFDLDFPYKTAATIGTKWISRRPDILTGGFTTGVPFVSVKNKHLVTPNCQMFMDLDSGSYGTTAVTKLLSHKLSVDLMYEAEYDENAPLDAYGVAHFISLNYVGHKMTGEFVFRHATNANGFTGTTGGILNQFRKGQTLLMSMQANGKALTTPGTTITTEQVRIDAPITILSYEPLSLQGNYTTGKVTWEKRYSQVKGDSGKMSVVLDTITALV